MAKLLERVEPDPSAKYAVFYSSADGADGGRYYDVHPLGDMKHELTVLAYEMNGQPLNIYHGAPPRLRCENELGFKQVRRSNRSSSSRITEPWVPDRAATTKTTSSTQGEIRSDRGASIVRPGA